MKVTFSRSRSGFTLAEILLAMLVFAIAISTILALLARSIEAVDEILVKDEAMRLSGAVESHMEEMSFNEAYGDILNPNRVVYAYQYRGDPNDTRSDGRLQPVAERTGEVGVDYVIVPNVRVKGGAPNNALTQDMDARDGRLFQVRMQVSPNNPVDPASMTANPDNYMSAVVVVFAEFYPVPTVGYTLPDADNDGEPDTNPAYSYNFAVRR